jgi:hypothetical protein
MATQNAELLQHINSASSKETYTSNTQKQIQALNPEIKKVESSIVPASDVVSFIEKLERVAKDNGLVIKNDSITEEYENNPKQVSSNISFLKIKSQTTGSWRGTYKFLSELEALPYKIKISSFAISNSGAVINSTNQSGGYGSAWSAVFEIRVLKYK